MGASAIVLGWLAVQLAIIGYVSWMQPTTAITAVVILALASQLPDPSIHAVAREGQKALTRAALVFTAAFASLILFNYVVQTTFLPVLAARANVRA